jgi:hypothetical protein
MSIVACALQVLARVDHHPTCGATNHLYCVLFKIKSVALWKPPRMDCGPVSLLSIGRSAGYGDIK